jgi:hypothetical protein
MNRVAGGLALAVVSVWVAAHLLYVGPVQAAPEATLLWVVVFAIACLVIAAMGLLAVGLALGQTRPAWLRFVRLARTSGILIGSGLIVVGLLHYRETEPHGEILWLVLGVVILTGTLIVHWWVQRATCRAAA